MTKKQTSTEATSQQQKLTLREALSTLWQIPLFIMSLVMLGVVLWHIRPHTEPVTFEQQYQQLVSLSEKDAFQAFYQQADLLRKSARGDEQVGLVHGLAARTRMKELLQRREIGLGTSVKKSVPANYEAIIQDYKKALQCNMPDPNSPAGAGPYRDIALAKWALGKPQQAIECLEQALDRQEEYDASMHELMVRMLLNQRGEDVLHKAETHLDVILAEETSTTDQKAWAFVRKQEVLIAQGRETEALKALEEAKGTLSESKYGEEVEFLRGRALHRSGRADEAELVLRDLLEKMNDRGDIYAQTALELARINYEQDRDWEARRFYQLAAESQLGKDWYIAAKLGLAECAALQQRYDEAVSLYQETTELLEGKPFNRAVDVARVQQSLEALTTSLGTLKQYTTALPFIEIEQKIDSQKDVLSAERFAQMHARVAQQLLEELEQNRREISEPSETPEEKAWRQQRQEMVTAHFEQAGRQYQRVAKLAVGNDDLYGWSLWQAAMCFDKAGNVDESIAAWRRVYEERRGDTLWPTGVFRLAQAYQANGQYDEAIRYYEELRSTHPRHTSAFEGIVPLARCYLLRKPSEKEKAKALLQGILYDRTLTPDAPYFRQAMFALGELHYEMHDYPAAINVLTEAIDRYGDDPMLGKSMFLVADSYRHSGLGLDAALENLASDPTATVIYEKQSDLRRQHLEHAREYFDRAIKFYEQLPEKQPDELGRLYLRNSYLSRADCLFDLGQYQEAVRLYELAVLRYQLTPTALTALMQVMNCQIKLDKPAAARAASERARWQLRKMSDEVLEQDAGSPRREEWERWFSWVEQAGMW
ncbi:MAG: tetratricopeptide repeat protein [Sedimentisphaerales bacterium]|nr:tetratricopeptide repeat protein [Sedimentisphaerales bacterium]